MTRSDAKSIRAALRSGKVVYSTAAIAVSPLWPRVLSTAGIDFVFVDSEHTAHGRDTLAWLCRSYSSVNLPTVVRIPEPDPFHAAMVLDGGAAGFIAPYIESAEQVKQLTAVARFRPLKGVRAQAALDDPKSLEPELQSYLEQRNASTLFIANIESVPAIENLDEILQVGSLDAVLIGPHDLSCSLGIPEQYDHPRFDEAVRTIFRKARQHGVGAGIHFWTDIDQEVRWAQEAGANLLMHSSDLNLLQEALTNQIGYLRRQLGDASDTDSRDSELVV